MLQQGHNETHLSKPEYQTFTHKVLHSPTPVVRMQELTMAKLFNAIRWSKASGELNCSQVCEGTSKTSKFQDKLIFITQEKHHMHHGMHTR